MSVKLAYLKMRGGEQNVASVIKSGNRSSCDSGNGLLTFKFKLYYLCKSLKVRTVNYKK